MASEDITGIGEQQLSPEFPIVDLQQRAERLTEVLDCYDTEQLLRNEISRFKHDSAWTSMMVARYGQNVVYKMRRQKYEKHQRVLDQAQDAFRLAYGVEEDSIGAFEEYQSFESAFRGSSIARQDKRSELKHLLVPETAAEIAVASVIDSSSDDTETNLPNPEKKISLARALRPEFRGLSAAEYALVDEASFGPNSLRKKLVSSRSIGPNSYRVLHDSPHGGWQYTTFTPSETSKKLLRTSPHFPAQQARNKSETTQHAKLPEERDLDAPRRSAIHSQEQLRDRMGEYSISVLQPQLELLERFSEAGKFNGGLARFGNEANMEIQLDYFWNTIVGDMLWAVRVNEGLPNKFEEEMFDALTKGIHLAETPAQRLNRFELLVDVSHEWITGKIQHLSAKSHEANAFLANIATQDV